MSRKRKQDEPEAGDVVEAVDAEAVDAEAVDAEAVDAEGVPAEAEPYDVWVPDAPIDVTANDGTGWRTALWRDGELYNCRRCAFNTTRRDVIEKHRCA